MIGINVKVEGLEQMAKALDNLAAKIENPDEKLMNRMGEAVIEDIDRRFMTRGYGTWPPLKKSTVKRKKGNDFVLVDTGDMFHASAITSISKGNVVVSVRHGGKDHDPEVPGYHQEGTLKMPKRKIVDAGPRLTKSLRDVIDKWLGDMAKAFMKEV
jgi:hypothetical protein